MATSVAHETYMAAKPNHQTNDHETELASNCANSPDLSHLSDLSNSSDVAVDTAARCRRLAVEYVRVWYQERIPRPGEDSRWS